jgi:hypothetical protein
MKEQKEQETFKFGEKFMCLEVIKMGKLKPRIGYKILVKKNGYYLTPFAGYKRIKKGVVYSAKIYQVDTKPWDTVGSYYLSGFHIFRTKRAMNKYLVARNQYTQYVAVKVLYSGILASGTQEEAGNAIVDVAYFMEILEEVS